MLKTVLLLDGRVMRHLDLFSGIGGFALAASWVWGADHEIVSFCEIEDYPQRVLKKHWPDVPCHGDIKTIKGDSFGTVDLITGGFPCQPFSVAGKQGGSSDDRHLWPEMFRVIQEARPTWIIGENVAGLVNMVEFEQCFLDLESEGYQTQAFIIPACGVDAPHQRYRAFIVANSGYWRRGDKWPPEERGNTQRKRPANNCQIGGSSKQSENVADPESYHKRRNTKQIYGGREVSGQDKTGGYRGSGGELEAGRWLPEPGVGRVANGIPSRVDRLKGLGNAIVPQCVVPIMQAIKELK